MSRQALIDETKTLFIAGYETTASAMTWTLALLAGHSDVAENWRAELDRVLGDRLPDWRDLPNLTYSLQILNESMRLFPPVYNVARECFADDDIDGYRVGRGSTMLISIYGIHRSTALGRRRRGVPAGALSRRTQRGRAAPSSPSPPVNICASAITSP